MEDLNLKHAQTLKPLAWESCRKLLQVQIKILQAIEAQSSSYREILENQPLEVVFENSPKQLYALREQLEHLEKLLHLTKYYESLYRAQLLQISPEDDGAFFADL